MKLTQVFAMFEGKLKVECSLINVKPALNCRNLYSTGENTDLSEIVSFHFAEPLPAVCCDFSR